MMINVSLSRRIYGELNNGRVINRSLYDEGREKDSPLYHELLHQKDAYTEMYDAMGYELVHGEGYFFIRESDSHDPHRDATVKVVALLTILGQATMQQGFQFSLLTGEGAGFSQEMAAELDGKEEYEDIKAAVGLKGKVWQEIKNILIERRIVYLNSSGRAVLTDCGKSFFQQLFENDLS
ncbi:MAG: hypothetical protein RPU52_13360 [Candidatus Sedimenticola sp. (ex Thyasira tokunagai)]